MPGVCTLVLVGGPMRIPGASPAQVRPGPGQPLILRCLACATAPLTVVVVLVRETIADAVLPR